MKHAALIVTALLALSPLTANAQTDFVTRRDAVGHRDFRKAKEVLPRVYAGHETDFYCGCPYTGKTVNLKACGYQVRKQQSRAERVEWEHVVPAWAIGHQLQCWQARKDGKLGGRKNCAKDPVFNKAEGDLVNLVPSVGEVNGDRSNHGFSQWTVGTVSMYGQCQTAVDFKARQIQPRPEVRGEIARIQFYMAETHRLRLSKQDQRLFCAWAQQHPVSNWERLRNQRITAIQGSGNRFVANAAAIRSVCK